MRREFILKYDFENICYYEKYQSDKARLILARKDPNTGRMRGGYL